MPYTPDEIAEEARRAFDAGARMVHVHARWDDGTPTQDADRYIATVAAIRERAPDMIVQVSTGGAIGMTAEERLGSLAARAGDGQPDLRHGQLRPRRVREPGAADAGVRPRAARRGRPARARDLRRRPSRQRRAGWRPRRRWRARSTTTWCSGCRAGSPAPPRTWSCSSDRLPPGSTWSATGIGRSFLPVTTAALACGGHVRCGFEDQVEVEPGVPAASNADLVERVVAIATLLGRAPATPARARELLGLT